METQKAERRFPKQFIWCEFWAEDKTSSTFFYSFLCFHPATWSCWKLPVNEPNWSPFFLLFIEGKRGYCSFLFHLIGLWICCCIGMFWKSQITQLLSEKTAVLSAEIGSKCYLEQLITNFILMLHIFIPFSVDW